jgi:acyl carrier protein
MAGEHSAARLSAAGARPPASARERLLGTVADVFNLTRDRVCELSSADEIADWDSLRTIFLATALEAEFGIAFEPHEIAALQSVPAIVEILRSKAVVGLGIPFSA